MELVRRRSGCEDLPRPGVRQILEAQLVATRRLRQHQAAFGDARSHAQGQGQANGPGGSEVGGSRTRIQLTSRATFPILNPGI